jgi:hypothetical protein
LKLAIHNPSFSYPGGAENIAPTLLATVPPRKAAPTSSR